MPVLVFMAVCAAVAQASERWAVFEIALPGPASENPYLDVHLSATFTQENRRVTVPGFWDGENAYKVRFSPPTIGEWRYETQSGTSELNGKTGMFTATVPTGKNHGPIEVFDTYYLRYADGTPYHQFGTTCYAWVHQTRALQEQTLETLASSPFNKIRFCVFPKSYCSDRGIDYTPPRAMWPGGTEQARKGSPSATRRARDTAAGPQGLGPAGGGPSAVGRRYSLGQRPHGYLPSLAPCPTAEPLATECSLSHGLSSSSIALPGTSAQACDSAYARIW